ncbi:ATP-grasp domain-containing protein [Bacillus sp. OK048]|uniref:ATP-grasp domain-containing protein n=1 Tax=Bacillus sp. OK048 TaxID=1882761 RepID=UPI000881DF15|nr:ATP-grasp domain-containing protein [Bacillus sp. OK048]SDM37721.1 ATP-grasp domain-containing protein [Bacillus sp. OK048]
MRIWFNRWFTTVSHFIELIRANDEGRQFEIFGTHSNKDALYLQYCDYAFTEPTVSGEDYIEFCLDFCQKHKIDIFIPRKENVRISKRLADFEAIGVKVLVCSDSDLMETLDNKAAAYHSIMQKEEAGADLVPIPDFFVVNNINDFKLAYQTLRDKGHTACFKPVIGEGATGFRVIEDKIESIDQLFRRASSRRLPFHHACEILSQQEVFPDLMVLEYLEGPEYSIDCVASNQTLYAAIPRMKGEGRIREIVNHQELIQLAHRFHQHYQLPYIFNIQVKYNDGVPKLLEVNPRMSGGMHFSCLTGLNLPYLAIKVLLGEEIGQLKPRFGIRASHLEKEMILDKDHFA